MFAQKTDGVQIDAAAEHLGELILHSDEGQTDLDPTGKLDEHIDVARRTEVVPQNGAEQREAPDAVGLANAAMRSFGISMPCSFMTSRWGRSSKSSKTGFHKVLAIQGSADFLVDSQQRPHFQRPATSWQTE
jgi:hypothetical protein